MLGILFINIDSLSGYTFLTPERQAALPLAGWDGAVRFLLSLFVEAKFCSLFSLLFGCSNGAWWDCC